MEEFIRSYGTLILAVYGIVQIWIITLWKKYIRQGKINIYETSSIEIGYSTFGPTIGLNGTLRALEKDVFVKSMDLLVIREKDKAQHIFKWLAYRPPKIDSAGSQPTAMEIPSSFLISSDSPHRFNIIFNDNDLINDIRPLFNEYIAEWYKVTAQLRKPWPPSPGTAPQPDAISPQTELIEKFRESETHLKMYTSLDRKCYWDAGDYSLIINVRTSKPDKVFLKKCKFSITDADSKNLKLNVIPILEEPILSYLRIPNNPYYFAYAAYKF